MLTLRAYGVPALPISGFLVDAVAGQHISWVARRLSGHPYTHHGLFPPPSASLYLVVGPVIVATGCGRSCQSMVMKSFEILSDKPLFRGIDWSIATPCSNRRSLSSSGSPDARVVMALATVAAFFKPTASYLVRECFVAGLGYTRCVRS